MASKSLKQILSQLRRLDGEKAEEFSELTSQEAEELSGGLDGGLNGACGNKGCPTSNTTCTPASA